LNDFSVSSAAWENLEKCPSEGEESEVEEGDDLVVDNDGDQIVEEDE